MISSPNYPQHYPLNATVIWFISVLYSRTIQLNFTDFNLEKNKKCIYDYVFIQETQLGGGSISRKYCGHKLPPNYTSLSNKIKVVFVSDKFSNVDVGFKANWQEVGAPGIDQFVKPSTPGIKPTPSCLPTTVTASKPCTQVQPTPNVVTRTLKRPKCSCSTKTETVTRTISRFITVNNVTPTKSVSPILATATVVNKKEPVIEKPTDENSNKVEHVNRCDPSSPFSLVDDEKDAAQRDTSKNLVVSLGVVLVALFITNIFLLVLLCKRERGYNAISFNSLKKYLSGRTRSLQDTPDIFYSSYTRPTLRMINGEIVVVPPPDPNSPDNGDTFVTLDAYHPDKQFTRPAVEICDQLPELPFHLIPQQHLASTINSGTDENTIPSTQTDTLSVTESEDS